MRSTKLPISPVVLTFCVLVAMGVLLTGCAPPPDEPAVDAPAVDVPAEPEAPAEPATEEPAPPAAEDPAAPAVEEAMAPPAPPADKPEAAEPVGPALEGPEMPVPEEAAKPAAEEAAKPAAKAAAVDPSKVSTYAPAQDLVNQVEEYLEDLEDAVENEEEYNDSVENIGKDANTLILIALALGIHDEDNKHKNAAGAVIKACQDLAASSDYASAKAAVEAVKAAAAATDGDPSGLKWEKMASLPELMEAVPLIDSRLKRYLRRLDSSPEACTGYSAVLAVIAQGSMANTDETNKPNEVEKWEAYCVEMRDAAAAVNAACKIQDEEAAEAAMELLHQSCESCHEIFNPEE